LWVDDPNTEKKEKETKKEEEVNTGESVQK